MMPNPASTARRSVPYLLIVLRFLIGPLLFVEAQTNQSPSLLVAGLSLAFFSDVFDGVIARRNQTVTARLRESDGVTDVWLYFWICVSAWHLHSNVIRPFTVPLLLVLGSQCLAWAIDLIKYRRFSNYHAYTAKLWGISLYVASVALFGFGQAGITFWLAIICGFACTIEEMFITLTLPHWTYDVASIFHAQRLRDAETTRD